MTVREHEVLRCCLDGLSVTHIARKFSRSIKTISTQKQAAFRKLGLRGDNELYKVRYQMEGADVHFPENLLSQPVQCALSDIDLMHNTPRTVFLRIFNVDIIPLACRCIGTDAGGRRGLLVDHQDHRLRTGKFRRRRYVLTQLRCERRRVL
ncbi:helix-turn-helix transcriptional regulator [Pseudomonas sp. PCH446]